MPSRHSIPLGTGDGPESTQGGASQQGASGDESDATASGLHEGVAGSEQQTAGQAVAVRRLPGLVLFTAGSLTVELGAPVATLVVQVGVNADPWLFSSLPP